MFQKSRKIRENGPKNRIFGRFFASKHQVALTKCHFDEIGAKLAFASV
jgi:hypothetical protein